MHSRLWLFLVLTLLKMNKPSKKLPICRNHISKFNNSIIDQANPQSHTRFQTTSSKNDDYEFEDNDIDDYGTDRRNYITNDDNVPEICKKSVSKVVKKSKVKIYNRWDKASNKILFDQKRGNCFSYINMFADNLIKDNVTTIVPSSNNKNSDMSDDNMPKTKRTRMTVPQKLSMGLNIVQALKHCPFCSHVTSANLDKHIMVMHKNVMNTPIKENIKQMLSTKSKSYKLIRLNTVRDIVGRKLWRDQKIRKVLYTLFKTIQVELWQGSWELPNVPFVNYVEPYVKASYMNDWYEQEEAEEVDEPCPSPLPVITYTEDGEQHLNNSGHIFNDSVQSFDNSVQSLKKNKKILKNSVSNIFKGILNYIKNKCSDETAFKLKEAGLHKVLSSNHPLISLCRKYLKIKYQKLKFYDISIYLEFVSKVLRYVQDNCYRHGYIIHHWLVLLQQTDFIIEYFTALKVCVTNSQDKEITALYLKIFIPLFSWAMKIFPYEDPTFPMVDGDPDSEVIDGFQYTVNQLINTFSDYI